MKAKRKRPVPHRGFVLVAAFTMAAVGLLAGQDAAPTHDAAPNQPAPVTAAATAAASKEQAEDAAGFKEFTARMGDYLALHKAVEKKLPAMKSKEQLPEMITAHQQALARKIREARPHAKTGDIFTPAAREAFRHVIRSVFKDPHTSTARTVTRQRDRAKPVILRVNGIYPDAVAETTFPPTLLQELPALPEELAYRIVGRELVLVDSKANLVVDLLHEALP
jgi:hypothetical protein